MNSFSIGPLVLLQPLWLLAAALLLCLAFVWNTHPTDNSWKHVLSARVFGFFIYDSSTNKQINLLLCTASLVALCLTQPVIRQSQDDTWRHSIGWIAVMDVSRSMTLSDTVPSRLSAARQALAVLSKQSGSRPIAMIIYAGDAFLVTPPSFDTSVFDEHAALLEHGVIEAEGSNLARALSLASSVVADSGFVAARVFVLSDTNGINSSSIAAARYLAQNTHRLDVMVFGTPDVGEPSSHTSVNRELAEDLARAGSGKAVYASSFGVIDYAQLSLDSQTSASTHTELKALVWKDQSHWLMLLALPLLLMQFHRQTKG